MRSNSNTPNGCILQSGQTTLLCVRMWERVRLYISFAGSPWHDDLVSVTILSRIKLDPHAIILLKSIDLDRSNPVLSMDCSPPSFRTTCNLYQGISKVNTKNIQRVRLRRTIIYSAKLKQPYHAIVLRMNTNYMCTLCAITRGLDRVSFKLSIDYVAH